MTQAPNSYKVAFGALVVLHLAVPGWILTEIYSLRSYVEVSAEKIDGLRQDIEMVRTEMTRMTPLSLHQTETAELARRIHGVEDTIAQRGDRVTRLEAEASHLREKSLALERKIETIELALQLKIKGNK